MGKRKSIFQVVDLVISRSENQLFASFDEVSFDFPRICSFFYEKINCSEILCFGKGSDSSNYFLFAADSTNEVSLSVTKPKIKFSIKEQWRLLKKIGFSREYIKFSLSKIIKGNVVIDQTITEEYIDRILKES